MVRHRSDRDESGPLVRSGVAENRVGDHDGRDLEAGEDFQYLVAVGATIEAVLMMHDRHVAPVEQFRARCHGAGGAIHELSDDPLAGGGQSVRHPHDAHLGAVCDQAVGKRCAECRHPARGRGVGAEYPEKRGAKAPSAKRRGGWTWDAHGTPRCCSVEASNLHGAITGGPKRPSCPSEATLPRRTTKTRLPRCPQRPGAVLARCGDVTGVGSATAVSSPDPSKLAPSLSTGPASRGEGQAG